MYSQLVSNYLKLLLILALTALPKVLKAQASAWVAGEAGKAYVFQKDSLIEINFHTGTRQLLRNAVWQALDSFPIMGEPDRLMRHTKPYVLTHGDTTIISFPGSGVVYGLNTKGHPVRLDDTYYGGYNFDSFRALHQGALYSIGGSGYWQRNGLILYFDQQLREWERITPFFGMPNEFSLSFGAQVDSNVFLLCNAPDKTVEPSLTDFQIYRVNLKDREAGSIGVFSLDDGSREHVITAVGHLRNYALFDLDGFLYVADVKANKLYEWRDLTAGTGPYNGFEGVVIQNDTVTLIYSSSTITNPSVRFTKVPYEEVLSYCEDIDMPVYRTTAEQLFWRYTSEFVLVFLALAFLILFLVRYNLRQPGIEKQFVEALNPQEVRLLRHLILLPPGRSADIGEIDLLLEMEDKSWENQRKIRSKSLTNINTLAEELLGYRDFVLRVPHPEDKRARLYHISPEYRNVATSLLRHV
jgi:DNA-binding MarR family transcriptional regulator